MAVPLWPIQSHRKNATCKRRSLSEYLSWGPVDIYVSTSEFIAGRSVTSETKSDTFCWYIYSVFFFNKGHTSVQFGVSWGWTWLKTSWNKWINTGNGWGNLLQFVGICVSKNLQVTLADPGEPWGTGPPIPQEFFNFMQFPGHFFGKTPYVDQILGLKAPLGSKLC